MEYIRPHNLDEALDFLWHNGKETIAVAGGTDVAIDLRSGEIKPKCIMDIKQVPELKGISLQGDELLIGAGTTISELYASEVLNRYAPALQKAAFTFASNQIRNVATIGGNVAHCSPCGDTIPPLIIHEARAVLKTLENQRTVPVESLATGPYRSSIQPEEIITHFVLRPMQNMYADFQKIGRRSELVTARISMALMAEKAQDEAITFLHIALGASTPTPCRMKKIETFLTGKVLTDNLVLQAGQKLAERMIEITGRRPSAVYKEKAVQGLLMRMLYPLV